jgi:5-methylcytosine-specific restriction endonuclease McrA
MTVYIPVDVQRRVRDQFGNCCGYCRTAEELTATTFEFDHISSRSAGGETSFENLSLACPMCNRFKSDHASAKDPENGLDVPLFHRTETGGLTISPGTRTRPKSWDSRRSVGRLLPR